MADPYADAHVYDVLHTPGTAAEVRGLLAVAQPHFPRLRRLTVLEPACGSGRALLRLATLGHTAIGFDLSPEMVRYAAERLADFPNARVFTADMTSFLRAAKPAIAPGSVHLAFNLINTIRHLQSDADMLAHFKQIARCLHPQGLYIVGLSLSAYGHEDITEDVWTARRGPLHVHQLITYFPPEPPSRDERVVSHLTLTRSATRAAPQTVTHLDSSYTLRAYALSEWYDLIDRSPLKIHSITDDHGEPTAAPPLTPSPTQPAWIGYLWFALQRRR